MKNKLDTICDLTGASKSTVSKAIRHCFGVEKESRELILKTARSVGVNSKQCCDYYCIFPDRPSIFWRDYMDRAHGMCRGMNGKYNVCPNDSDFVFTEYIEEAGRLGAKIIVMGARPTAHRCEILKKVAKNIPILFLFERVDINNTFCIISDAFADGEALCRRIAPCKCAKIAVIGDGSELSKQRTAGFLSCTDADITYFTADDSASASELARILSAGCTGSADIIYNSTGQLRETALAAVKLGLRGKCLAAGHDFGDQIYSEGDINGINYVGICQNTERICELMAESIEKYVTLRCFPDSKYTVVSWQC